jgi:UDP-3-O-[3-hydroxymyristoyl] glucosamine N-acyltransferase
MSEQSNMVATAAEVAERLGGFVKGDATIQLRGIKPLNVARENDLSFLHLAKFRDAALRSTAGAIIVNSGVELGDHTLIVVADAGEALRIAIDMFYPKPLNVPGVSPRAIVDDSVIVGADVFIGAGAIIGAGTTLGDRVSVMAGAVIGEQCRIGNDSKIYYGSVLYPGVVVGQRVVIHANTVVGSEGFGFRQSAEGKHYRVRHVGNLIIEDDVEIGACTCIDRATLTETRIGKGSKLDNLVHIAHNVELGEDCLVIAQTCVAGSVKIGSGSILCMQTGVREHLVLGERTTILARGFVIGETPPDSVVAGFPAMPAARWRKLVAITKQLPEIFKVYRKQLRDDQSALERRSE